MSASFGRGDAKSRGEPVFCLDDSELGGGLEGGLASAWAGMGAALMSASLKLLELHLEPNYK
jgi:hypothetical protein